MEPRWKNPDMTDQVEAFMLTLPDAPAMPTRAIFDAVDVIAEHGPGIGRPLFAEVSLDPDYRQYVPLFGHRLHEVRPLSTTVRILALFGPDRTLVLLYAGDKVGDWNRWYRRAIPVAAALYKEYLENTGQA
jgi:hypothetical protein